MERIVLRDVCDILLMDHTPLRQKQNQDLRISELML